MKRKAQPSVYFGESIFYLQHYLETLNETIGRRKKEKKDRAFLSAARSRCFSFLLDAPREKTKKICMQKEFSNGMEKLKTKDPKTKLLRKRKEKKGTKNYSPALDSHRDEKKRKNPRKKKTKIARWLPPLRVYPLSTSPHHGLARSVGPSFVFSYGWGRRRPRRRGGT